MGGLLYLYDCMLTAFMSVVASAPLVWYVDNGAILTFQESFPAAIASSSAWNLPRSALFEPLPGL